MKTLLEVLSVKLIFEKIGIIVDEVKEVVTLSEDCIDKPTYNAADGKTQYLTGIGKPGEGLISLLNIADVIVDKENV